MKGAGVGKSTGEGGDREKGGRDRERGKAPSVTQVSLLAFSCWWKSLILQTSINLWLCFPHIHLASKPSVSHCPPRPLRLPLLATSALSSCFEM